MQADLMAFLNPEIRMELAGRTSDMESRSKFVDMECTPNTENNRKRNALNELVELSINSSFSNVFLWLFLLE
jgi:hypothetical protein